MQGRYEVQIKSIRCYADRREFCVPAVHRVFVAMNAVGTAMR